MMSVGASEKWDFNQIREKQLCPLHVNDNLQHFYLSKQHAAACDKVYQLLAQGPWFSPGTPAASTTMI